MVARERKIRTQRYKSSKSNLNRLGKVDYNEYFLQTESHDFCCGCYTCIEGHEEKCPHAAHVQPVIQAMRDADGLIFATPVYVMDMTAQMKAFLDHTGYFYMVHRPYPEMFQKSALVISTAAGGGTKDANASIARSLKHWGVRRIFFLWDFHLCAGMGCHSSHSKTEHREETPPYNRPLLALFGNEEAPDPTYTRPLFCDADDAEEESRDER